MMDSIKKACQKSKETDEKIISLEFRLKEISDEKLTDYTEVK